jgi:hypothetical protein
MEGFPKQDGRHFLSEEEVVNSQTEEDITYRRERHQKLIGELDKASSSLKSKLGNHEPFTTDDLRNYGKIYNEAVRDRDLDSKYTDEDNVRGVALIKEKMVPFWRMLSEAFDMTIEDAKLKNDENTLRNLSQAYFHYGDMDEPKYHEYLGQDFKDMIDRNSEQAGLPKKEW